MTALLLEPLIGHPKELREFIENTLEAPFEGTPEAKKAVTEQIFDQFPQIARKVQGDKTALARAAAKREKAEDDGTTTP